MPSTTTTQQFVLIYKPLKFALEQHCKTQTATKKKKEKKRKWHWSSMLLGPQTQSIKLQSPGKRVGEKKTKN